MTTNSAHLLLVEPKDDSDSVDFLLESLGFKVTTTDVVGRAIMMAASMEYDLIVANLDLTGGTATELVQGLRAKESLKAVPVVVIAAFSEENELEIAKCIQAGADDFLSVDILETIVASRLTKLLEWKRLHDNEALYLAEIERQARFLEERKEELERMNELKNKFIGMAAHDLRNPLVSIRGFSEIMLDELAELPTEEKLELLRIIHDASDKMLGMVNDMLDVSVIESGHLELELESGVMAELVEQRLRIYEPVAQRKGIRLEADCRDPGECNFDPNRIAQVLDNLITNAIKFSPLKSLVTVALEQTRGSIVVKVADEGPGISEADQEKLFQHFQKLSARPTAGEDSTGLGLAIVKTLVDAHGGELGVNSRPGEGATFYFELPTGGAGNG